MGNKCFKTQWKIIPNPVIIEPITTTTENKLKTEENKTEESAKSPEPFKKPLLKREGTTTSLMDIRNVYKFDPKVIGNGVFGTVRVAVLKNNSYKKFAVKTIFKEKVQKNLHLLKRELEILKTLDHPNIVKFYETYQDDKFFHFVMEFCSGGELLERIADTGCLNERESSIIMKKVFSAVKYLHEHGIVHRDLKPENFLFSHKGKDAEIKMIDFGLSRQFEGNEDGLGLNMQTMVGTAFYVAPEVLNGKYDNRCDNWSLGVITYILLCGHPPFYGETTKEVFELVKKGKLGFHGRVWKKISKQAKDFISKLICVDLNKRMTAEVALQHVWLNMNIKEKNNEAKITPKIINSLKIFRNGGRLKKEVIKIMVNLMTENEVKNLKETFQAIDKQNKGKITLQELKKVMNDLGYQGAITEINNLINNCHDPQDYEINYSEFIAANLEKKNYLNKDKLQKAFKHFDVDNSDSITVKNLKESMAREGRKLSNPELADWIKEVDKKSCGKIGFDEFLEMMNNDRKESIILQDLPISGTLLNMDEEEFFKEKSRVL